MKLLYVTFFEPVLHNGIYDSQVKQFLCHLATNQSEIHVSHCAIVPAATLGKSGLSVPLLTERSQFTKLRQDLCVNGVKASFIFLPIIVLRRWGLGIPLLTILLLLSAPALLLRQALEHFEIIHCRGYGATILAVLLRRFFRDLKVICDPRGFFPEEGVVLGRWSERSFTFRLWKQLEKHIFKCSDRVVALSEPFAKRICGIADRYDSEVIYAPADLPTFAAGRRLRRERRLQLGLSDKTVFVYNGSLHAWHDPQLLAEIFRRIVAASGHAKLLVITRHHPTDVRRLFESAALRPEDYLIVAAEGSDVPSYLAAGDFGLVPLRFLTDDNAMKVVADTMIGTKVAEYLAAGLPLVVNQDVGGLRTVMDRYKIGVSFHSDNLGSVPAKIQTITKNYAEYQLQCEYVASRYFSVDQTVCLYADMYRQVLSR
jgi:glycosyltransferase involved in cell wall biosynthesis